MKKQFKVTLYQETYTEVIVSAETEEEANDKALEGDYDHIEDVVVKESAIEEDETVEVEAFEGFE